MKDHDLRRWWFEYGSVFFVLVDTFSESTRSKNVLGVSTPACRSHVCTYTVGLNRLGYFVPCKMDRG